jgi:hypothetical protein
MPAIPAHYAGGKSLVAEVLMLARMHQAQQALQQAQQGRPKQQTALPRGLLVLPYLSIVSEKTAHLSMLLEGMKWRVTGYRGETEGQPLSSKVSRARLNSMNTQQPPASTSDQCNARTTSQQQLGLAVHPRVYASEAVVC